MMKTAYKVTFPSGDVRYFPTYPATYERYSAATINVIYWDRKQRYPGRVYAGP